MRTASGKHGVSQEYINGIQPQVLLTYYLILERICVNDIFPGKKCYVKEDFKRH